MRDPDNITTSILLMHCISLDELTRPTHRWQFKALADLVGLLNCEGYSDGYIQKYLDIDNEMMKRACEAWHKRAKVAREAIKWAVSRFEFARASSLPPRRTVKKLTIAA